MTRHSDRHPHQRIRGTSVRRRDGSGNTTRTVLENTVADQNIGPPVSATDDEGRTLTYELGGAHAPLSISTRPRGRSRPRTRLDHETQDSYSVTVSVSDGKNDQDVAEIHPMDTFIDVTIEVEDVNEKRRRSTQPVTELEVAENTAATQDIGARSPPPIRTKTKR